MERRLLGNSSFCLLNNSPGNEIKGAFNIRISSTLSSKAFEQANLAVKFLNQFVEVAIKKLVLSG